MEARGWLHKRTTGRIITWKRRFFVLDKNCIMSQYKIDISTSRDKQQSTSSFQVTGYCDHIGLNVKLPTQFDASLGILLTTSNPKSPQRIVLASTIQEKRLWINSLASCLRKEANFKISTIVELGKIVNKNVELEWILRSLPDISPSYEIEDTTRGEQKLTCALHTLIAAFVGSLVDVTRLSRVSRGWHKSLGFRRHQGTPRCIHSWLVRHGAGLTQDIHRWYYWQLLTRKKHVVVDVAVFDSYASQATDYMKFEIKKDVDRAFGVTDKRICRRSTISERGEGFGKRSTLTGMPLLREVAIMESFSSLDDEEEEEESLPHRPILPSELSVRVGLSEDDVAEKKECLTHILEALAGRFPSVGYCQGIDRVVVHIMRASRTAVSLASLAPEERRNRIQINTQKEVDCFAFLEALFESLSLADVYSRDGVAGLRMRMWQLARLFEYHCSELFQVLEEEGMSLDVFCIGWVQTLFLYIEAMPAHTIDRIWDIMIFESSWVIIFQVSVALVKLSSDFLNDKELDEIVWYFNNFPDPSILEPDVLLVEASKINLTDDILEQLRREYENTNL